ncbi:MAG: sulfite oxidase [Chloroflexi bacterium]|nr:MAG: sulfite oxidase [Chloroflexota bacterium]
MDRLEMSRRTLLKQGSAALTGWALLNTLRVGAAPAVLAQAGAEVLPWLEQPAENPVPEIIANQLTWEDLDSWVTPNDQFFSIAHYNRPEIDADEWHLEITGLVKQPLTLTLDEIKALPRQELTFTLECSGNHGLPFFWGGIGNASWAGAPLAGLLEEAGVLDDGIEVVFWGVDAGEETIGEQTVTQHFARSLSLADAMHPDNLLCYEMNGEPLPQPNGFPLRLIAPGWFGIANVKWLQRIEVWDTRLMNRFMARDYVTVRQEGSEDEPVWTQRSVGRALLKSAPARVVHSNGHYRIDGAAWGAPIRHVDVKIDDGPWRRARLDRTQRAEYAWSFWSFNWANPTPGEHAITTRAVDTAGNVQPAADDPLLANKLTYWESNGQITRTVEIPT